MPLLPHPRWLLLSDIHFRQRDFERTRRTAEWIVSLTRQTPGFSRVVICGDVLTSRSMQPTAVLSAAYRFLSDLSSSVPHVNVILGNHDLAYRRDYGTTALEALNMSRLQPFVSLHDEVAKYNWDGRQVLVLPFREDQTELTDAVAELRPTQAARTVAFAHLALNRAITQRYIVRSDGGGLGYSVRYKGLTGPDHFSALARTFTGHFHSHQTIFPSSQPVRRGGDEDRLMGTVTYLGAPLQLTWADLYDEDRGIVLLNPVTLEHELIVNPHAIGYVAVQGSEVLNDQIDPSTVQGKHVMILGKLTQFRYWTARDKLLSLGAQSVRESRSSPTLMNGASSIVYNSLGASVPASDRELAFKPVDLSNIPENPADLLPDNQAPSPVPDDLQLADLNPAEYVREYVQSVEVEFADKDTMIRLGQRLISASESADTPDSDEPTYKMLLDPTYTVATEGGYSAPSKQVFVARPRSITISNFLGVQEDCKIDFDGELGRGLIFVVGNNGSGKSTLIEAIVWCQFGRCIRKGVLAGDVVNDTTGKDCMVSLSFSNGYTITRYRKHTDHGNRVVVSLDGIEQAQFEHGEARNTQTAIDDLLGIAYEEFIKTVVLGHESAASFLSSTPSQRHDLIESTLRLSGLDKAANLSRKMVRDIDEEMTTLRNKSATAEQTMSLFGDRIRIREEDLQRLQLEYTAARQADPGLSQLANSINDNQVEDAPGQDSTTANGVLKDLKSRIQESQKEVDHAQSVVKEVEIWEDVAELQSMSDQHISDAQVQLQTLRDEISKLETPIKPHLATMEQMRTVQSALSSLASTMCWLEQHAMDAMEHFDKQYARSQANLHFIRLGLMSLEELSFHLTTLSAQIISASGDDEMTSSQREGETERIHRELAEKASRLNQLIQEREEAYLRVSSKRQLDPQCVRSIVEKLSDTDVKDARRQLSTSLGQLSDLLKEQSTIHNLQSHYRHNHAQPGEEERVREPLIEIMAKKEQEIKTYQHLIDEETSILNSQRASRDCIELKIESLMSTRELFSFWEESLSRRRTRSANASTFRGYVLDRSLEELNAAASQILLVLYENTRHARELTSGMLRTIVTDDADEEVDTAPTLLDQTLGVTKTLSYAKRSGGERKRIDLAVFFALVHVAQARSTHRARYMLVDEAFDSLDAAGQSAVVRWCSQFMARTDFQLVVTHSSHLTTVADVGEDREEAGAAQDGGDDEESRFSVLTAAMTKEGTKFSYDAA
ncbi:P-loop containing nucleoside triphosphate hydrolase protein [Xylariaceae sp. FL0255]|nr:P-loop containing nucleoside triphosphate hydrolase protein [Xylariaceae sp. FL0255]